jgi:hypothetical protein
MLAPWADQPKRKRVFLAGDIIHYGGVKSGKCLVVKIAFMPEYKLSMYILRPFEGTGQIMVPIHKMMKVGAFYLGKATA